MLAEWGARWLSELEQIVQKVILQRKTVQKGGQAITSYGLPNSAFWILLCVYTLLIVSSPACVIPGSPWSGVHQVNFGCRLFPCQGSFSHSSLDQI